MNAGRRSGFTIIELLVSIALGMIIMMVVATCFSQSSDASRRALALLQAHHKARAAISLLHRDLWSMCPYSAFYCDSDELIFMRTVQRTNLDGDTSTEASGLPDGDEYSCDLVWVKYKWIPVKWNSGTKAWEECSEAASTTGILQRAIIEPTATTLASPPNKSSTAAGTLHKTFDDITNCEFAAYDSSGGVISSACSGLEPDGSTTTTTRPAMVKMKMKIKGALLKEGRTVDFQFAQVFRLPALN